MTEETKKPEPDFCVGCFVIIPDAVFQQPHPIFGMGTCRQTLCPSCAFKEAYQRTYLIQRRPWKVPNVRPMADGSPAKSWIEAFDRSKQAALAAHEATQS